MNVVLTIAGSDSGGGAGIQADLKTFESHEVFGTTVITAITAQNTCGVHSVFELPIDIIDAQIDAVLSDFNVKAIKIGMLANAAIIETVAKKIKGLCIPIVLDPVMVATSGDVLLKKEALLTLKTELMPLAKVMTPNKQEAELLSGMTIQNVEDAEKVARYLSEWIHPEGFVLVKGGHLFDIEQKQPEKKKFAIDISYGEGKTFTYKTLYQENKKTHGTGCSLSAAIAANLANGDNYKTAIWNAKIYVHTAIMQAPTPLGKGDSLPILHRLKRRKWDWVILENYRYSHNQLI